MTLPSTPPSEFRCDRCSHCCRTHRVPLTRTDVHRLKDGPLKQQEFTDFLSSEEVDMTGEPESFAWLKEGRRVLVLRHTETTGGCVFLNEHGCGVHRLRPSACRTYPYDRPESGEGLDLVPGAMCPPETGVLVTLRKDGAESSRSEFVSAVRKRDQELEKHADFVSRWNLHQGARVRLGRTPKPAAAFLEELLRDSGDAP